MLGSTSVCFDMSVFEVFHTLGVGGTLVLAENALELLRIPARDRVTLVNTVPSAAAELLRTGGIPASVRTVNLGGEALKGSLAQGLYALPHVEGVYNLYGPTEDTTYSTWLRVERGAAREPTVGRPVTGTRVHLLDAELDAVPAGETGEVYLAGEGLARDYLGRPELTAEKYLPDPFSREPGARMYRVGDLGRILPDGELEYLGRVDHQVKVRGFRVELGEIETVLETHPAVREAAVAARDDGAGGTLLAAYFVPLGGAPAPAELRAHLRERLPEYMVPSAFVGLERFPLTPSGKTDRMALPAPDPSHSGEGAEYAPPRNPTEETVAAIWAEVLGVERVGIHEHFFDLGGHSLRAAQIVARLRGAFQVDLPMGALFDAPTVAELAALVEGAGGAGEQAPPLARVPRDQPLPLSFSQEAIWFFQELAPGMKSYNFQASYRFRGALDADALERALAEIIRRHEIFRTVFHDVGGSAVQVVHDGGPLHLARFDLRDLPETERDGAVQGHMAEEFGAPFDLGRLPLIRWRLLRLADDEHLLLQVEHHFVHDGWSFAVFLRELVALYSAFAEGRPSPLPELPVQFADFAVWHRRLMEGERARQDLAYWKEALAGADPVLELPTDRPRPPTLSFRGASLRTRMPADTARAARAFCRESGATLYMTLLAAFEALMGRYSGQEDFCVGGGVANRSWKETEDLIGMIVNTIAHRVRLDRVRTFRELVAQVRDTAREAYAHKDVHFGQVVEAVAPERTLSRLPIYQVTFNFHDSPYPDFRLPGVEMELTEALSNGSAKFDFQVIMMPRAEMRAGAPEDEIDAVWEFATDLFDPATVERMIGDYHRLLAALLAEPDRPFRAVPLDAPGDRARLLEEWSRGPEMPIGGRPVHAQVVEAARARPDAAAVVSDGGVAHLRRAGPPLRRRRAAAAGAGASAPSRAWACSRGVRRRGSWGCWRPSARGAPTSRSTPRSPPRAWSSSPPTPGVAVVLATEALRDRVPGEVPVLPLDGLRVDPDGDTGGGDEPPVPLDAVAFVIYTSGSTGTPKGVEVTHRGLLDLTRWYLDAFGIGPDDRSAQVAGLGFDASVWETLPYLAAGARVHQVTDEETRTSPPALQAFMLEHGVTLAFVTTVLGEALMELEWPERTPLRALLTGGEALRTRPRPGIPFTVLNVYGPTETTLVCTGGAVEPGDGGGALPSIGRPLANVRTYVADPEMEPVAVGLPGELYVGGPGVARGYGGRPALTAEKFVPDPFSGEPGARLYRTGDRVRWRTSGELEFLGRIDQQVKLRGFRIEPGEIEAVLRSHPEVRDATVLVRDDVPGGRQLVAYTAARATGPADAAELRGWLRERLPEYMVPAAFVAVDSIPLTPNGKVDRRALPAPEQGGPAEAYVAPRTAAEEQVAAIWAEVLGVQRVGVLDNFFEHGGALPPRDAGGVPRPRRPGGGRPVAARPVRRPPPWPTSRPEWRPASRRRPRTPSRTAWSGWSRSPRRRPSVCSVRCERGDPMLTAPGGDVHASAHAEPEGGEVVVFPLSFPQQRLWLIEQVEPGSPAYNLPSALRARAPLDAAALERALAEIVTRHESLRTRFGMVDGEPAQLVGPPGRFVLPVVDLASLPGPAREAEAGRLSVAEGRTPFDLGRGPLFRARLLRLAPEEHLLLVTLHHIVSDGWSIGVLLRELSALYRAFAAGEPSPLAELPIQYGDYAVWQREELAGDALEEQVAFWRAELEGAPPATELPVDRPHSPERAGRAGKQIVVVPAETARRLAALARAEGATTFMALLAACGAWLGRYADAEDVVLGTPIAGRTQEELEGLIGFFVNTLAIRVELSGDPTFAGLVARVRARLLGAYAHQDLPFEKVVEELRVPRDPGRTPVFQAMFMLQAEMERWAVEPAAGAPAWEQEPAGTGTAKFDLSVGFVERPQGLAAVLDYDAGLFDAATAERMAGHLLHLLDAVAADPRRPLSDVPLLPPGRGAAGAGGVERQPPGVPARAGAPADRRAGPAHPRRPRGGVSRLRAHLRRA
nr:non-ribosomal peptide synthetase [uncultured bacterium]